MGSVQMPYNKLKVGEVFVLGRVCRYPGRDQVTDPDPTSFPNWTRYNPDPTFWTRTRLRFQIGPGTISGPGPDFLDLVPNFSSLRHGNRGMHFLKEIH